jgi:hypothetical protein
MRFSKKKSVLRKKKSQTEPKYWNFDAEKRGWEGRNELPARVYRLGKGWDWFCLHK